LRKEGSGSDCADTEGKRVNRRPRRAPTSGTRKGKKGQEMTLHRNWGERECERDKIAGLIKCICWGEGGRKCPLLGFLKPSINGAVNPLPTQTPV